MRKNGCTPGHILGISWDSTDSNLGKLFKGDSLALSGMNFWVSYPKDLTTSDATNEETLYDWEIPDSYLGSCITYSSTDPSSFILKESSERQNTNSDFFNMDNVYNEDPLTFDRSYTSSAFPIPLRCSDEPSYYTTLDYQPPFWTLFTAVFEGFPLTADPSQSQTYQAESSYPKAPLCKIYANKTLAGTISLKDLFNDNLADYYSSSSYSFNPSEIQKLLILLYG